MAVDIGTLASEALYNFGFMALDAGERALLGPLQGVGGLVTGFAKNKALEFVDCFLKDPTDSQNQPKGDLTNTAKEAGFFALQSLYYMGTGALTSLGTRFLFRNKAFATLAGRAFKNYAPLLVPQFAHLLTNPAWQLGLQFLTGQPLHLPTWEQLAMSTVSVFTVSAFKLGRPPRSYNPRNPDDALVLLKRDLDQIKKGSPTKEIKITKNLAQLPNGTVIRGLEDPLTLTISAKPNPDHTTDAHIAIHDGQIHLQGEATSIHPRILLACFANPEINMPPHLEKEGLAIAIGHHLFKKTPLTQNGTFKIKTLKEAIEKLKKEQLEEAITEARSLRSSTTNPSPLVLKLITRSSKETFVEIQPRYCPVVNNYAYVQVNFDPDRFGISSITSLHKAKVQKIWTEIYPDLQIPIVQDQIAEAATGYVTTTLGLYRQSTQARVVMGKIGEEKLINQIHEAIKLRASQGIPPTNFVFHFYGSKTKGEKFSLVVYLYDPANFRLGVLSNMAVIVKTDGKSYQPQFVIKEYGVVAGLSYDSLLKAINVDGTQIEFRAPT